MFDAIDFQWNENNLYKANYMQNPFNTLKKENLDKLEKHCKKAIHYERKDGMLEHQITLNLLYKYEEQQEELIKKNKIIDLMANRIFEEGIVWKNKEEVKQYFERKVENGN